MSLGACLCLQVSETVCFVPSAPVSSLYGCGAGVGGTCVWSFTWDSHQHVTLIHYSWEAQGGSWH